MYLKINCQKLKTGIFQKLSGPLDSFDTTAMPGLPFYMLAVG